MTPQNGPDGFDPTRELRVLAPGTIISHYKIIEKIGAGGMGVVYKALDTKLDRAVALKFLSPGLLCDPDARARFEHEARAASALSHANITTIHEIDEVGGQCFIVMELVEGKTVWELVSGEGSREMGRGGRDLSLAEVMDLALQIGKGLDAAHKRGVVHRDIKSANIMVTEDGTAKIMDFGLAKLKDATKLTRAGTTMGTLPYMSPEQLRGEAADQRSDIFSFGVVLYEMIAGRLPFRGETEGEIITAILGAIPEPLARYKAGVSWELERIVAKALAKDKHERYQHADDMVADLRHEARLSEAARSAVVGSAGLAEQVTQPGIAPAPAPTPPPTGQPAQPTAVGPTATQPTAVHPDGARPTATPTPARPRRRKGLWIALAAAAATAAAALILILEPFHVEMGPSEQAQAMENSLAVMYFENMADPQDTDRTAQMVASLLITDLSESDNLYVISRQRLYDILNLLNRADSKGIGGTVIDSKAATEVAERAGAKWILTGSILKGERNLVLTSDISETASGRIIATQRVSGQPGDDLFALVDKLSGAVKADLALPQKAGAQPDRPVADVTTHSPEAYRYYVEGLDYRAKVYSTEAEKAFRKALEFDSTFAMAYLQLAVMKEGVERQQLAAKAMKYIDKVNRREKYALRGLYAAATGDYPGAVSILLECAGQYPDDKDVLQRLADIHASALRDYRKAIEFRTTAIKIDPLFKRAWNGLAYNYNAIGDLDSSIWAINQYIAISPGEANPYDTRGDLYAQNGKLDEAIASYKEALRIKPDFAVSLCKLGDMYLYKRDYAQAEVYYKSFAAGPDKMARSEGRGCLALLPIHQGRFEEALKVLDDGLAADRLEQCAGPPVWWKLALKAGIFSERGEPGRAVVEAKAASDIIREAYGTPATDFNVYYIYRLAEAGKFAEAEAEAQVIRESLGSAQDFTLAWECYWLALACVHLFRGSPEQAVGYFEKIVDVNPNLQFQRRYILSEAYLAAGSLADAVKELEKAVLSYDAARAENPILSPKLHYLLGQAYEQSGWKDKAVEQYREFLRFWGDGDPGIASVEDARKRLAGLGAGT